MKRDPKFNFIDNLLLCKNMYLPYRLDVNTSLYMKEISDFWLNHLILKVWTFKWDIKTCSCSVGQMWSDFFLDYLIHSLDFEVGLTIWRSCHVTHKCSWLMFFNILSDTVISLSNPYPFQSEVDPVLSSKVIVIF